MINQRGIIRTSEFVLLRTTTKSSRVDDYRRVRTKTLRDVWVGIPTAYKNLIAGAVAIVLGVAAGAVTPLVTQTLQLW